jgi:hypothetical protein
MSEKPTEINERALEIEINARALEIAITLTKADYTWLKLDNYQKPRLNNTLFDTMETVKEIIKSGKVFRA